METGGNTLIASRASPSAPGHGFSSLDDATASRSTVLASLIYCEEHVELPPDVDISDLRKWEKLLPEKAPDMSPEELFHALKVCLKDIHTACSWHVVCL